MRKIECWRCGKLYDADHFVLPDEMICMLCDDARQEAFRDAIRDKVYGEKRKRSLYEPEDD